MPSNFLHITTKQEWDKALKCGEYIHPSIALEGFIHCSYPSQILWVANSFYPGRRDLILLEIDPKLVVNRVQYDHAVKGMEPFPHIYGTLNTSAVVSIKNFLPDENGTFTKL